MTSLESRKYVTPYGIFLTEISNACIAVALPEIRQYQKLADNQIPKLPFRRLVREFAHSVSYSIKHSNWPFRWQSTAIQALREAAEAFLVSYLEGNTPHNQVEASY